MNITDNHFLKGHFSQHLRWAQYSRFAIFTQCFEEQASILLYLNRSRQRKRNQRFNMSTLQHVALFMFLIFLPMGRGVFCSLLLFNFSSVHCISNISAGNFVLMLVTVADLVKLKPEFDEFSLLFHITAAFVSILLG